MPLIIDNAHYRRTHIGIPDRHADRFREVAATLDCVILSRAVGPTCLQLLEQGYDTKGFRVHGKSCDWGPMAGFVMRDPRLNKSGLAKVDFNRREHHHAMADTTHSGWRASTTHLKLFPTRVRWLINTGKIRVRWVTGTRLRSRYEGMASQEGVVFYYALIPELTSAGEVFGVYVDVFKSSGFRQECDLPLPLLDEPAAFEPRKARFQPLMAMTNPATHRSWPDGNFRNAITGDYDLFGVWPRAWDHDPEGDDRRILGTSHVISQSALIDAREADFVEREGGPAQGTKIGNITNRIYEVCQFLNSSIGAATCVDAFDASFGPFPQRMVCWHSDENARPGVMDVDLPFIAFIPRGPEICVTTISDFEELIGSCHRWGFHVTLAEGWTMTPDSKYPNRLGAAYARYVPTFATSSKFRIPRWYNR